MICHRHRCIFINPRKCAGISVVTAFGIDPTSPDSDFAIDGPLSPEFEDRPPGYRVFSVVRNPWDRFVSGWKYLRSTRSKSLAAVLDDLPTEGADFRHLTRPQSAVLFDSSGAPVFDRLLRFETLQADFDQLCDEIGKPRMRLPKLNSTPHRPYASYYTDETAARVGRLFRDDVERFGYAFSPARRGLLDWGRSRAGWG